MPTLPDATSPEDFVRQYLLFLDDPGKLRDPAEIQRRTQAVLAADDPIAKLKALAELERAATVEEEPLRKGFIDHARAWAEGEGVPAGAFRELGVPDDVLRSAGFEVPEGRPGRTRGGSDRRNGEARPRARAVTVDQIKAHLLDRAEPFILADVMGAIGGSPATVRKAVDELVEAGRVVRLGVDPNHEGRGRAPIRYRRV
ncbi:MAG TPA: hypothetical protein VFI47_22925 [Acidimicrobiales bacterium]|nr:hypothetical protein [Acidimicrobiales bacterium]